MDEKQKTVPPFEKVNRTELRFTQAETRRIIIEHIRSMNLPGTPSDDGHIWIDFDSAQDTNTLNVRFTWD